MVRKYFGTDGIRGRANGTITPELALKVGQAAGLIFRRGEHRHRVLIGKDTRLSGYMIETALVAGFTSVGMDVFQTGPMPTPAVAMLTRSMRADLGVMISASHNPYDDNGIKLFGPDGFQLLAVIAESWQADGRLAKPGIVATIMSNLGLERYLGSLGISLARTPVGDRYVLEQMRTDGFNVGGESSGHIILSDYTTTGDGLLTALQVLAVVKKQDQPVSKVCHRFDPLPQILKNVRYASGKPLENAKVRSAIADAQARLDGHGRLIVRSSGTEPVIRVMGEGDDKVLVEEVVDGIVDALTRAA